MYHKEFSWDHVIVDGRRILYENKTAEGDKIEKGARLQDVIVKTKVPEESRYMVREELSKLFPINRIEYR